MVLNVIRKRQVEDATLGELYVDGRLECYTLEPVVRPAGEKVPGKTAIPEGTYEVIVNWSNRFGQLMPLLLHVPNFEGVRIHVGNRANDTSACLLVGQGQGPGACIAHSKLAYDQLFPYIQAACRQGKVFLTITREFAA